MTVKRAFCLAAGGLVLLLAPGNADALRPLGGKGSVLQGTAYTSREDGPPPYLFGVQITSQSKGPTGISFEGNYADELEFFFAVKGKLNNKNRLSFAGKGGHQILSRGVGPLGGTDPDATASVKFSGQVAADLDVVIGTYKTTYKNLDVAGSSPFKDYGGFIIEP